MCLSNNTIFQGPISRFAMCQLIIYWPCKHEIQFERILIFFSFTEKTNWPRFQFQKYLHPNNMPLIVIVVLLQFLTYDKEITNAKWKPISKQQLRKNTQNKIVYNQITKCIYLSYFFIKVQPWISMSKNL